MRVYDFSEASVQNSLRSYMYAEMSASYGTDASRSGSGLPVVKCTSKSNCNLSELFIKQLKFRFHVKISMSQSLLLSD